MTRDGRSEFHHSSNHPDLWPFPPTLKLSQRRHWLRGQSPSMADSAGTKAQILSRSINPSSSATSTRDQSSWLSYRIKCPQQSLSYLLNCTDVCNTRMQSENKMYKVHRPTVVWCPNPRFRTPRYLPLSSDEPVAFHDPHPAFQSRSSAGRTGLLTSPTVSRDLRSGYRSSVESTDRPRPSQ